MEKLRNQPDDVKRIIVWTIVIILGLILFSWWLFRSYRIIDDFSKTGKEKIMEEIDVSSFKAEVQQGLEGAEKSKEVLNSLKGELETSSPKLNNEQ